MLGLPWCRYACPVLYYATIDYLFFAPQKASALTVWPTSTVQARPNTLTATSFAAHRDCHHAHWHPLQLLWADLRQLLHKEDIQDSNQNTEQACTGQNGGQGVHKRGRATSG